MTFSDSHVEDYALAWLAGLGYAVRYGPASYLHGLMPQSISYG